ncbi:MAG: ribosome maturation factor RimM [Xanthobacteraceae bacterium]|uniref:ribosome maturation factor RimM n=1 Tax=Pseudolabrys sp. TaxID=1960880 RepID=UPI003D110473
MADRVCVARIGAAHGVRGEVKLWPFTDDPLALADFNPLETKDGARTFEIEIVRAAKDHLIARIGGVTGRDAVQALTGIELYVPRDRLPPLTDDGAYYRHDLIGLAAVTTDGAPLGTVLALHNFGAGDVIEIGVDGGEAVMLPFTDNVVPEVDLVAKRVVIAPPGEIEAREGE